MRITSVETFPLRLPAESAYLGVLPSGEEPPEAGYQGAYVADVYRRKIFERDGWRCQICSKAVLRSKAVPHPRAPTIDHIIPLARGGTHEPANAQLACFACNCLKSHTGTGDQLRLIG